MDRSAAVGDILLGSSSISDGPISNYGDQHEHDFNPDHDLFYRVLKALFPSTLIRYLLTLNCYKGSSLEKWYKENKETFDKVAVKSYTFLVLVLYLFSIYLVVNFGFWLHSEIVIENEAGKIVLIVYICIYMTFTAALLCGILYSMVNIGVALALFYCLCVIVVAGTLILAVFFGIWLNASVLTVKDTDSRIAISVWWSIWCFNLAFVTIVLIFNTFLDQYNDLIINKIALVYQEETALPMYTGNIEFNSMGVEVGFFAEFIELCGGRDKLEGLTTTQVNEKFLKGFAAGANYYTAKLQQDDYHQGRFKNRVKKPNVFVSHAWMYKFLDLVDALEAHFEQEKDTAVLWFDMFCNDQNDLNKPFEWWTSVFSNAIRDIGRTVMVVEPWDNPVTLTRAWCLWEVYVTHTTKVRFEVAMNRDQKKRMELMLSTNIEPFYRMLCSIDVKRSNAWSEEDKKNIFGVVLKTVGFNKLNLTVVRCMSNWLVDFMTSSLSLSSQSQLASTLVSGAPTGEFEAQIHRVRTVAKLLEYQGSHKRASQYLCDSISTGRRLLGEHHHLTIEAQLDYAIFCIEQGNTYDAIRDLKEAIASVQTSVQTPTGQTHMQLGLSGSSSSSKSTSMSMSMSSDTSMSMSSASAGGSAGSYSGSGSGDADPLDLRLQHALGNAYVRAGQEYIEEGREILLACTTRYSTLHSTSIDSIFVKFDLGDCLEEDEEEEEKPSHTDTNIGENDDNDVMAADGAGGDLEGGCNDDDSVEEPSPSQKLYIEGITQLQTLHSQRVFKLVNTEITTEDPKIDNKDHKTKTKVTTLAFESPHGLVKGDKIEVKCEVDSLAKAIEQEMAGEYEVKSTIVEQGCSPLASKAVIISKALDNDDLVYFILPGDASEIRVLNLELFVKSAKHSTFLKAFTRSWCRFGNGKGIPEGCCSLSEVADAIEIQFGNTHELSLLSQELVAFQYITSVWVGQDTSTPINNTFAANESSSLMPQGGRILVRSVSIFLALRNKVCSVRGAADSKVMQLDAFLSAFSVWNKPMYLFLFVWYSFMALFIWLYLYILSIQEYEHENADDLADYLLLTSAVVYGLIGILMKPLIDDGVLTGTSRFFVLGRLFRNIAGVIAAGSFVFAFGGNLLFLVNNFTYLSENTKGLHILFLVFGCLIFMGLGYLFAVIQIFPRMREYVKVGVADSRAAMRIALEADMNRGSLGTKATSDMYESIFRRVEREET